MYPVSAAYKTAIGQNVRDVRITGTITLKDNSVINITDEDIVRGSLYITEQCVAGEDIEVGNVYASEMGLSLSMPLENPYSLDGARIIINFGINVETDPDEPPIWEYVPLGYFYVTEIQRKANNVNLTALDGMLLFDIPVGDPGSSSPRNFVVHACEQAGVPLGTSVFEIDTFANATLLFAAPDTSKIKTCRDLLMWACQIMGAFARMNRQGELEIVPIKARASVKTISKAERFNSDVSDFAVKITRVSMQVGETVYSRGTDGMTMILEENPLMTGLSESQINQMLDYLLAQITTAVYVPFNSNFIGDPALQPGDFVTLSDTSVLGGGDVASIITHSTWRYRGPHNLKAAGKHGLVRGVQNQQIKAVSSIVAIARAAQDLALSANQSTQLIKDAIGGHVLIRQNPDETNEILIMDNPDPDQAVKIWRWNMGGLGYSDNCVGADNPDREYEIAMTMDGAINANFIKTGQLDAGVVRIGPQTTFAPGYDPTQIVAGSTVGMGVDADCVGLWHFDGSLNSHKGVAADSDALFGGGCFGQALSIATGKHLKVPTTDMLASAGVINFRAKNLSASSNGSVLIDLPDNVGDQGIFCGIADDGKLFIEDVELQFQSVETSQADFNTGTLVDVVATSAGNLELAKDGTDVTYTETSQTDFQSGTLTDVVATSAGDLQLATGKALGTREKVVDLSSVGANNYGSIINFTKTDAVVTNATFTRPSVAYLSDGTQVASGQPRFEDGKFGKAVLVEEGTTNSIVDPVFAVADSWPLKSRTTFKASGGWAQDTCVTLCEGSSGSGYCYQYQSLSDGQSGVMSVYVKMSDGSEPVIGYGTNQMALVFGGGAPPVNKTYIGDGWWRLTAVMTGPYSGYTGVVFYNADNTIYPIFSNIQLEKDKGYVTSFTPGTRSPETLTIPTAGVLNLQEGTIALWFKPSPAFWNGSYNKIIGHATALNINELSLARLSTADKLICYASNASGQWSGGSYSALSSTTELEPNKWYHLAFTWKTGGKLVLYVNGVKEGEINYDKPPSVFGTLAVGYHPNYSGRHADGLYDELRIDKIARTDEEIAAWYNSDEPMPFQSGCAYKMNFDNNLQATVGTVDVEVALSTDGGDNYGQYSEVKSGLPIPGLTGDTDLTNGRLKIKETLYTSDVSVTPQLHSLDFTIYAYVTYKSSGYRYKEYDISAVGSVGSSKITWTENTPASTTLTVKAAISTDGGSSYSSFQPCTNGGSIPGLTQGMDVSNARLKVQEDLATSDGTKTPQLQSLTIEVGSDVQTAYGPNKSTLTGWDSISLAWKPERLSLVVNDEEACYIENPGLPAALGSHVFIGTDRNGNNAINTLVDELRIDKVYREPNIRTAWHKTGVPFYTSEDMKQWPGYVKVETDGLKVYDPSDALRVLVGSWLKDAVRKYGIKIIDGEIYSSLIRSGAEDATEYIQFVPPNRLQVWYNNKLQFDMGATFGGTLDFYHSADAPSALDMVARISGSYSGADMGIMGNDTGKIVIGDNLYVTGNISKGGTYSALEPTLNYGDRLLYAAECPELKYYDSGVANLQNGEATIYIDPIFLECIEPDTELTPWQIWVQCYGENDVYVAEVGTDYFVIKERNGGTSNNKVIWRFEAIRKNYAGIRLMEVV